MFSQEHLKKAAELITLLSDKKLTLSVAESCTGGLLGGLLTSVSGSSHIFVGGLIAYSDEIKKAYLKIPYTILKEKGAVSSEVAKLMSANIRSMMKSDLGIGITGMAEAAQNSPKEAGLIYISIEGSNGNVTEKCNFLGDRHTVRTATLEKAIEMIRVSIDA